MKRVIRIIQAFFKALSMTLRGEALQPPDQRYPNLSAWVERGQQLSREVFKAAERSGITQREREALTLKINRREMSAETILAAVRHNMQVEYPMLMDARVEHNLTTLYAINMNDQYRVQRLADADALPEPLQPPVQALSAHLQAIPSSQNP